MKWTHLKFFLAFNLLFLSYFAQAAESFDLTHPHFGAEIEMMPGTSMGGQMTTSFTYQSNKFEAYAGAALFSTHGSGDPNSTHGSNNQWLTEVRGGPRFQMNDWNFVTAGIDYAPVFGTSNGISISSNYTVGPYIGFARQFPNSNVLLTAFVIPYEFQSSSTSTGMSYGSVWFVDGGIGIDYLF